MVATIWEVADTVAARVEAQTEVERVVEVRAEAAKVEAVRAAVEMAAVEWAVVAVQTEVKAARAAPLARLEVAETVVEVTARVGRGSEEVS